MTLGSEITSQQHEQQPSNGHSSMSLVMSQSEPETETQTENPEAPTFAPYAPASSWDDGHSDSHNGFIALMDALIDGPGLRLPALDSSLTYRDKQVHDLLSNPRIFHDFHKNFMIGRSFSDGFREAITMVLQYSNGVGLNAYSTALALWDSENNKVRTLGEVDLGEGSQCLKQLQAPAINHLKDAAAVIMLGQILLVYHVAILGTSAHAIVRRSLLLVKDWYPSLLTEPSLYPITITPIFIDTIESLVKREIPVIQVPCDDTTDCSIVDRWAGLCVGLIDLQYEVCKISHRAKRAVEVPEDSPKNPAFSRQAAEYAKELEEVNQRVHQWEPKPSKAFFSRYSQPEVSAMLMQARIYRLATLLIIHRLRYPLGFEDECAAPLAMTISAELECFVKWVPDHLIGIPIRFPLLVALLEIDHVSEEVIQYASQIIPDPNYVDQLWDFIRLAKLARDNGFRGLWFDLAEDKLSIPVLA